jgi:hypothetical protein
MFAFWNERLSPMMRTQQKQHLSFLLSFAQASLYPSGQLRIMSAMIGPPVIQVSNGTRKPNSPSVRYENYTCLIAKVDNWDRPVCEKWRQLEA